ncbi:universal stress protein [Aquimarina sp. 2201CG5-10]|uniref:universal stress protein n=1 Tax=Aquimarina callyspongiae TaxID=3098150 RepID=UPI002AB3953B|nr:universal stress protein [Aquimarina sp. 2201CG5-10]MDY8134911.1 universal stress protein [Aquimarina sp. 2201CG5-10]
MKRILLLTDFSDKSWNAIVYAIEFYRNTPCKFVILNVYDLNAVNLVSTVSSQRVGHYYDAIKLESKNKLQMILEDIQNSSPASHHFFKVISKPGSLYKTLQSLTTKDRFDIILMGTKGTTGAKEIFIGSTALQVIRESLDCPILIIPEDAYYQPIHNIAFATDFERVYYKSEITPILNLAKRSNAIIRMIHIYRKPKLSYVQKYNSSTLEAFFKNVKYDFHVIPEFSTIEKGIQAFIEELDIDVLTMINYKHSFLERLTREPIIKKITFHLQIPFLIIPSDN